MGHVSPFRSTQSMEQLFGYKKRKVIKKPKPFKKPYTLVLEDLEEPGPRSTRKLHDYGVYKAQSRKFITNDKGDSNFSGSDPVPAVIKDEIIELIEAAKLHVFDKI